MSVRRPNEHPIGIGIYDDHDGGVAAVRNGKVLLYCEFERMTRLKYQTGLFPEIVEELLRQLPLDEVSAISIPHPNLITKLLLDRFDAVLESANEVSVSGNKIKILNQDNIHPLLHVLAILPLQNIHLGVYAVLVFDAGQPKMGWVDLRTPLQSIPDLHLMSLSEEKWYNGAIFADFFGTIFYGSPNLRNSGKLMGLASWGKTKLQYVKRLSELAEKHFDPATNIWEGYQSIAKDDLQTEIRKLIGTDSWEHEHSTVLDLASSAQELFSHKLVEQVVAGLKEVRHEIDKANISAPIGLLYGGGCGLSVVTNSRIREAIDLPLIVPPYTNDSSQFLGAAIFASMYNAQQPLPLGVGWDNIPRHTVGIVSAADIEKAGLRARPACTEEVAERIISGELIALIDGASEAGPRALGMRSLLANALDPEMRWWINSRVKMREWYRPFAPALPADDFMEYFREPSTELATYMLDSFSIIPHYRSLLTAVSSPDGTSRPQAVYSHQNPWYYDLLKTLGSLTGHPVVLNTSLNAPGLPIAFDLSQSLKDCEVLGIDAAVISGMLLERDAIMQGVKNASK